MAKFITLKQIIEEVEPRPFPERDEDEGEDDGLDPQREVQPANAGAAQEARQEWKPNTMQVDAIRNFYPRKGGKPGSRVLMKTGTAYIVVDTHDEILAMIQA